jgi:hypothetical protein
LLADQSGKRLDMLTRIIKRTVDAARPRDTDQFLWDSELKGFGLKVTPVGSKVYILQYRKGGRGTPTERVTIGRHGALTPEQARGALLAKRRLAPRRRAGYRRLPRARRLA